MIMHRVSKLCVLVSLMIVLFSLRVFGQGWDEPIRGSWVAEPRTDSTVLLVDGNQGCEIVVAPEEHSAVKQAVEFLAQDISKITGVTPEIVEEPADGAVARIHVMTLGMRSMPEQIDEAFLLGQWETFQILATENDVYLVGSNFRGTAFAVYTLSERLGIDPLYHWTGYEPEKHNPLAMKAVDYLSKPPTFKYRGLFHDDEDILPRPIDPKTGYPYIRGEVPIEWYQRYFETALRLKMNMVAPFVRVTRNFEVQQMASDWGLFYSSHHYDILLSNPYGFSHFGLAAQRGVTGGFDWFSNREGMIEYWKGGVLENRLLDCIWPIGMRGTDDYPYSFPANISETEKLKIYQEIIDLQVEMTKELLPSDKEPIFHFTMYGEMLDYYRKGSFRLPNEVILVWDDDGDGVMRQLPSKQDLQRNSKHGVYYHLAFFGWSAKQTIHTVTPMRIEQQFRKIIESGATEYMLLNVSELREHVMETRMIADIVWDAERYLSSSNAAYQFVDWWSREYFGSAAKEAGRSYRDYYRIMDSFDKVWYGTTRVSSIVQSLEKKFATESYLSVDPGTIAALRGRAEVFAEALEATRRASLKMTPQQQQFFFEHVEFGMLIDYRSVQAALKLSEALQEPDLDRAFEICLEAFEYLKQLELEIKRAERPPFEDWYQATWIRVADYNHSWSNMNPHRSYLIVKDFLLDVGGFRIDKPRPGDKINGQVPITFSTNCPRLRLCEVLIEMGDRVIYEGTTVPRRFSFDSTVFSDGPEILRLTVIADDPHLTILDQVSLSVANWWTIFDPLKAPQTTWFGTINHDQSVAKSRGWVYLQDDPEQFFKDESRISRVANTTEYLVWETPRLQDVQVTAYARGEQIDRILSLAISNDGDTWQEVPYTVVRTDAAGQWLKLVLSVSMDNGLDVKYCKLTIMAGESAPDDIQIGEVLLRGRN